jgi:hypothetical protein
MPPRCWRQRRRFDPAIRYRFRGRGVRPRADNCRPDRQADGGAGGGARLAAGAAGASVRRGDARPAGAARCARTAAAGANAQAQQDGHGSRADRDAACAGAYRVCRDRPGVRPDRALWRRISDGLHRRMDAGRRGRGDAFRAARPAVAAIAASETAGDALARLAVVPMVLEARALDITPSTIARFEGVGDHISAKMLQRIMTDEIRHVSAGTTWFSQATNRLGLDPVKHYQILVKRHFRGSVKPPFNDSARRQAGLTRDFYDALAS